MKIKELNFRDLSINKILRLQLYSSFLVVLLYYLTQQSTQYIIEVIVGSLISFSNMALVCWSIRNIFLKKFIAISIAVIVLKWAVLAVILYILTAYYNFNGLYLIIGLSSLVPGIFGLIFVKNLNH